MKKFNLLIIIFILFLVMPVPFGWSAEKTAVPAHIMRQVFEKSRFAEPIVFPLPCERQPTSLPPRLVKILAENGLAEKTPRPEVGYYYAKNMELVYSSKIKPYIVKGTYDYNQCEPRIDTRLGDELDAGFYVLFAVRTIKSIDYHHLDDSSQSRIKYYDLDFTYTFTEKFPGLPKANFIFEGKARAYLDPDDGGWKLDFISLPDNGGYEYWPLLTK